MNSEVHELYEFNVYEFIYVNSCMNLTMNSYGFFIYEFICFINSYMNLGVPRFQMVTVDDPKKKSYSSFKCSLSFDP